VTTITNATTQSSLMAKTQEEVFRLLTRKGPLHASEISIELSLPVREVHAALSLLRGRGLAAPQHDRTRALRDELCAAWGLPVTLVHK
jgi:predicted transcriptional regulator